jgi:Concanavalin A-like lectin/glucanases superfamily
MKFKQILLTAIAMFGLTATTIAQVPNYVPSNGLVGWWPFNGNANDGSGNGHNGTVNGATLIADRMGNANSAYSFNGLSNYISCSNANYQLVNAMSLSVWVKLSGTTTAAAQYLISKGNDGQGGFNLDFYNNTGQFYGGFGIGSANVVQCTTLYPLPHPSWHHIVFTYDGSNMKLYNDNILTATQPHSQSIGAATDLLLFGKHLFFAFPYYTNGNLDDIAMYNRALTPCEIQALYYAGTGVSTALNFLNDTTFACGLSANVTPNASFSSYAWSTGANSSSITVNSNGTYACTVTDANGCLYIDSTYVSLLNAQIQQNDTTVCAGTSLSLSLASSGASSNSCAPLPANLQNGLVGYWPFCGNANDESGNGNNGTVNGATLITDRFGNGNQAYSFDGINDHIFVPSSNLFSSNSSSKLTFSCWVNSNVASGTTSDIFNLRSTNNSDIGSIWNYPNNQKVYFGSYNMPQSAGIGVEGSMILNNGIWYNFIAVYDYTINNISLYINGILISTTNYGTATLPPLTNSKLTIGARQDFYNTTSQFFDGKIDDFIIWNRVLN